uniref:putative reverse transcriptase/maturase n=1 Tax=Stylonema alsidii TaxID=35155 RepID=UPI001FCD0608|nr:putative reverse transcriptase/maturase [Stylonema alsidii]UNJ15129.1 putative reverse transcriptase/maturase [Stylonema alsidii]
MSGLRRLKAIYILSKKKNWIHQDIFRILNNSEIWTLAYIRVKMNYHTQKNKFFFILDDTISKRYYLNDNEKIILLTLQNQVINEKFFFTSDPTSNLDNFIVQEVIYIILNSIYSSIFEENIHSLNEIRHPHYTLSYIEDSFQKIHWVIENKANFSSIKRYKILSFIQTRVHDDRFLRLINKSFQSNISYSSNTSNINLVNIFYQIYYYEFDSWVMHNILSLSKIENKKNKTYIEHINMLGVTLPSFSNIEISYVRYKHSWLIGISDHFSLGNKIKNYIQAILIKKFKGEVTVTNLYKGKILFLDYEIFFPRKNHALDYYSPKLRFELPVNKIKKLLLSHGYLIVTHNHIRTRSKISLIKYKISFIVKHYHRIYSNLANYYSGSTSSKRLRYIHYLLFYSCAMTLAHKQKTSITHIFKTYGKNLTIHLAKSSSQISFPIFLPQKPRKWQKN